MYPPIWTNRAAWTTKRLNYFPVIVGYDPEPGDMSVIPQNIVVQQVANDIATASDMDFQPHMWPDNPYNDSDLLGSRAYPANRRSFFWQFMGLRDNASFFVSALENGTTTGVLREHAIRLNSSVTCSPVSREEYPETCPGERPFTAIFANQYLEVRTCVPGEHGVTPWTLSRNRQDIDEEMFIDVMDNHQFGNYTVHCTASTTRGYFELGNSRNSYAYGPLLNKWPDKQEMANEFNDYLMPNDWLPPSER